MIGPLAIMEPKRYCSCVGVRWGVINGTHFSFDPPRTLWLGRTSREGEGWWVVWVRVVPRDGTVAVAEVCIRRHKGGIAIPPGYPEDQLPEAALHPEDTMPP